MKSQIDNIQNFGYVALIILFFTVKFFYNKILNRFWTKNVETEYVTNEQCKKHRAEIEMADTERHSEIHKELKCIVAQFKIFNELFITAIMDNASLTDTEKKEAMLKLTRNGDGH